MAAVTILLAAVVVGVANAETNQWFLIPKGQSYVADFQLKPGGSQELVIKTNSNTVVSFQTDATSELARQYKKAPYPVQMTQVGAKKSCASVQSIGTDFDPVKGEIRLVVKNGGQVAFKVVILTGEMEL